MMPRPPFELISAVVFTSLAMGLAAFAGNADLPEQDSLSGVFPFQADALEHRTWADPQTQIQLANANQFPAQIEAVSSEPSTRSSLMATWETVSGANGYLLDVSASDSFGSFVGDYHDLDVGNVAGRVVTGLDPGTTYYYRVRPYYNTGQGSYSETITATTTPTTGLTIDATFDSSITNHWNAAAIEAMINRAIAIYELLFTNGITIHILFRYAPTAPDGTPFPPGAAAQSIAVGYQVPWNDYISALRAHASGANDIRANASLPGAALSTNIIPKSANGRSVGLNTPPALFANGTVGAGGPYDGIVTLNSSFPYGFTRPVSPGNFDAQRATEHEIDEIIGLGSRLGHTGNDLRPQDLFSWSSPGVRNISTSGTRYFSINGGSTNIVNFNQNQSADLGDWASTSCPQARPYVQNAFFCPEQASDIAAGSPEGINLDVIGYNLATATVTTDLPTNITNSSVRLNGRVNPNGLTTSVHFEYGRTTSYGSSGPTHSYSGNATQRVSIDTTGLAPNTRYHFRIVGTNILGTVYGSDETFTTVTSTGPVVAATTLATSVASFSATLNGSVYPHGLTTTVYFQYGTTTGYGLTTPADTETGNRYHDVTANINGLTASTTYHYRIVATNSFGTRYGGDRTFTTLSPTGRPVVTTDPATLIASFSARVNGSLDPHGLPTTVYFQYGTTTGYGLTTAPHSHTGNTFRNITANVSGLAASTTYHFRSVATNSAGTTYGADRTFRTLNPTGPPILVANEATNVTSSSATLNGMVDPHGMTTRIRFQYGTTNSYGFVTPAQSYSGNTYQNVTANINGLTASTTYHFRMVAANSVDIFIKYGPDKTFTTP
jgi:phosphodiesterase/alkaline phosphatase D-like protein